MYVVAVHSLGINLTSFCKGKNIYICLLKVSPVIALFYPKVWVKMIPGATGKGELENTNNRSHTYLSWAEKTVGVDFSDWVYGEKLKACTQKIRTNITKNTRINLQTKQCNWWLENCGWYWICHQYWSVSRTLYVQEHIITQSELFSY